jgi:hypothetical protein
MATLDDALELSWEYDVSDYPTELWRLVMLRPYKKREVRMTCLFESEGAAEQEMHRRIMRGDVFVSCIQYCELKEATDGNDE